MPAAKYTNRVMYSLAMDAEDKGRYEAAAHAERLSLADWINRELRASLKLKDRRARA